MNMYLTTRLLAIYMFSFVFGEDSTKDNSYVSERINLGSLVSGKLLRKVQLQSLTYQNCGSPNDPVKLETFDVQRLPSGDVNILALANLAEDFAAPVSADIIVMKKVFNNFIKFPCIKNLGSCSYKDVCQYDQERCPVRLMEEFDIPCRCPIKKGPLKINKIGFPIPEVPFASAVVGDYQATIKAYQGTEKRVIMCLSFNFTLV